MKLLLALLALSLPAFSSTYNCVNNATTDTAGIQAQLNAGGSQTTSGTCKANNLTLGTNGLSWQGAGGMTITASTNGGVTLNITATGAFTMNALDFEGFLWNANNALTGCTITNNTLENTTGGSFPNGGGWVSNGFHSCTITGNTFNNLFSGGYTAYTVPGSAPNTDTHQPACWEEYQGIDGTLISNNIFTKCGNDGFHIQPNGSIHSTNASEISHNNCTLVMRACFEIQAFASNLTVKDNYAFNYNMPSYNSFAYSIASVGTNFTFINNFGSLNHAYCQSGVANFLELFLAPSLVQGNVAYSLPLDSVNCVPGASSAISWNFYSDNLGDNTTNPSNTNTVQNNIMCGNSVQVVLDHEDSSRERNIIDQYNYKNSSSCPGSFGTSNVASPVFTSGAGQTFPSGGSGTWTLTQISTLPIASITWKVDGAFQSIQELGDVNTNFASDLKWHYHTTFNTSAYSNGTHTIQATATDVLGATNSASQTFTVGSITGPSTSFSPTSLSFGAIVVGSSSSPSIVTLTNVGSATLNLSSITITGSGASDFSKSTTCGSTLGVGSSCTVTTVFTPSTTGSRTAALSFADDAPASPQTVGLSGTGATAVACSGVLLNCAFSSGTASWTANVSPFATWTVDGSGPATVNAAHFMITSVIPSGNNVELLQDGITYGSNGVKWRLTFLANTNHAQQLNIRGIDSTAFTDFGLTFQPVITPGWKSYTTTFNIINSPGTGAGRFTIQMDNGSPGDNIEFTNVSLAPDVGAEVTNVIFPFVSHGSMAVAFTSQTSESCGTGGNCARVRYIAAPGICTGGTGGTVQGNLQIAVSSTFAQYSIGGLAPNTTYQVCPEVSKNNGSTWSSGFGAATTTAPLPATHPSLPIAPLDFNTDYPDISSYFIDTSITIGNCAAIGTAYSNALTRWATQGTVIQTPPGTNCNQSSPYAFSGLPPDVHTWQPSDVNTANSTITWTAHGFLENDLLLFGRTYATLTTYPASTSCDVGFSTLGGGGIQSGQMYQVHVVDANTIQVYCLPTTQFDPSIPAPTPPLMVFTTQGASTSGGFYAVPFTNTGTATNPIWQRRLPNGSLTPWIIWQSSGVLPPEHTQITPAWLPNMFTFTDPVSNITNGNGGLPFIIFGDPDPNVERPVGNIRIVGAEITTADYATGHKTSDPWYWNYVWATRPWDNSIICDRCYYHMLGAPNREFIGMSWDGSNLGWIDSYTDNATYHHAANTGLVLTQTDSTHFGITAGTAYTGFAPIALPNEVVTISGSGSGRVRAYFDLTNSSALTVSVPTGITASCSPTTCVTPAPPAGSPSGICNPTFNNSDPVNYTENVSDLWPKTANGEVTVGQIGCADVTSGSITTAGSANPGVSAWNAEGDDHMVGGIGPGPYKMVHSYASGAGIPWFWNDAGNSSFRANYNISQNYFYTDPKWMHGSSTSDGEYYFIRQPLEWKGGQYIKLFGNIFDTTWREDTPDGSYVALTPLLGAWITDVNMQYNTWRHGSAVIEGINTTCNGSNNPCAKPGIRTNFFGNLIYDINGYTYSAFNPNGSNAPGLGWTFQVYGQEDNIVDYNTNMPNRGTVPWLLSLSGPFEEGYKHLGNIDWFTGVPTQTNTVFGDGTGVLPPSGCGGLTNVGYMNCIFTQGAGTTNYTLGQNLLAGGYTDSSVPSGQSSTSTMSTAFTGLNNSYLASGTVAGTVTAIKWANPTIDNVLYNYHLAYNSPYTAGANSFDQFHALGADIDTMDGAQGLVKMGNITGVTASAAVVNYYAPDSQVCHVLLSTTNSIASTSPTADAGGSRTRNVSLSGLTGQTTYYGWAVCPGNAMLSQKAFSFRTH